MEMKGRHGVLWLLSDLQQTELVFCLGRLTGPDIQLQTRLRIDDHRSPTSGHALRQAASNVCHKHDYAALAHCFSKQMAV